ncbi:MAG TPA: hypothetical protein VJO33_09040 [Gemmatimonadaceae bacterium]|nr:hypothetical protein [Gemmatimonadaceae bacterium]
MRKFVFLAAALATLAACNNDSTSPNGSAIGTYSLVTVNGSPLPFTFSDGSVLISDRLTLNSGGSYVDFATFSNAGSVTEQGIWSISNNLISFNDQSDNFTYDGSLSGSVLTESFPNTRGSGSITEVYQKN